MDQPATVSTSMRSRSWIFSAGHDRYIIADPRVRILLYAFTILFFELLCIRWIPAYVKYLSYFNNFILLAAFLGIGLGILAARRERFWFPPFPVLLLLLVLVVAFNRFELRISSTQVLYYGAGESQVAEAQNFLILPLMFGLVVACFIPLARPLGLLFTQVRPLTAYTADILGSLAGTAAFFVIAWLSLPPVVWFALLTIPLLLLSRRWLVVLVGGFLAVSVTLAAYLQQGAYWSPYYKILLHPAEPSGYIVDVNNAGGHQAMIPWQDKEPFYRRVYEIFPEQFDRALILGAGSGSDVATALAYGVGAVTAVEIDPKIQELGQEYNPDRPYQDPRVRTVINDGRAYLRNSSERYDLIIFALPDSLTLTSGMANLRLESFLLTEDAIAAARARLSDDGLLVLYNYYREDWLIEKLAGMVGTTFNQDPLVSTYGGWGRAAVIMAGPKLERLPPGRFSSYVEQTNRDDTSLQVIGEGYYRVGDYTPATDDWPFLYLRERTFPRIYLYGLVMVALFSAAGVLALAPQRSLARFDWHMFSLGVAFAMLEVKSLVTFALLFGSTWMVNSLVFFAILTSVLIAIQVNRLLRIRRIGIFYGLLFGLLIANLLLPPDALLFENQVLRYVVASALAFGAISLANVIFSNSFRDTEAADIAFASNLLGIMVGGMLEYLSMLLGYQLLLLPVIGFYALALLFSRRAGVSTASPSYSAD